MNSISRLRSCTCSDLDQRVGRRRSRHSRGSRVTAREATPKDVAHLSNMPLPMADMRWGSDGARGVDIESGERRERAPPRHATRCMLPRTCLEDLRFSSAHNTRQQHMHMYTCTCTHVHVHVCCTHVGSMHDEFTAGHHDSFLTCLLLLGSVGSFCISSRSRSATTVNSSFRLICPCHAIAPCLSTTKACGCAHARWAEM